MQQAQHEEAGEDGQEKCCDQAEGDNMIPDDGNQGSSQHSTLQQQADGVEVDIDGLVRELIDKITENLYVNVCRGLFEAHKIIYSFMISTSIKKNKGLIDETSYNVLLRG